MNSRRAILHILVRILPSHVLAASTLAGHSSAKPRFRSIQAPIFQSRPVTVFVVLLGYCCAATTVRGQFATVYNVPPDVVPQTIHSNTQVNVFEGGSVGSPLSTNGLDIGGPSGTDSNMEVNFYGGISHGFMDVNGEATINVSGGQIPYIFGLR